MSRILITRPLKSARSFARMVESAGHTAILFPTIEIRPLPPEAAFSPEQLLRYDWIVFTSANAVAFTPLPPSTTGAFPRVAAIGAKTAAALEARGVTPDLVPSTYTAEVLTQALGEVQGQWILFPSADIARDTIPKGLARAGGIVHQIIVYRTLPAAPDAAGLAALREGVDWLTFTSPSTAQNFAVLTRQANLDPLHLPGAPRVACIGPVTADAARELGFRVDAIAEPHTAEGLLTSITNQRTNEPMHQ